MFVKKKCLLMLLILGFVLTSCGGGDPFSPTNMEKAYVKYMSTNGRTGGIPTDKNVNKFVFENVVEIKNFKIVKGYETKNTEHYIEFTFDTVYRVAAKDLISKFPQAELAKVVGDKATMLVENWQKNDFKAGAEAGKSRHLAMMLKKFDAGWEVTEVGLPN